MASSAKTAAGVRRSPLQANLPLIGTVAIPLISAVLGAIVGAIAIYFVSQNLLVKEQRVLQASDAYSDYLLYVSEAVPHLDSRETSEADTVILTESIQKLAAAKARVGIFGSQDVVFKLSEFADTDGDFIRNKDACQKFTLVLIAMRKHLTGETPDSNFIHAMKKTVYGNIKDC